MTAVKLNAFNSGESLEGLLESTSLERTMHDPRVLDSSSMKVAGNAIRP